MTPVAATKKKPSGDKARLKRRIARLEAEMRAYREVLEKVANWGAYGISEAGCALCVRELDASAAVNGAHLRDCPVGKALHMTTAVTRARAAVEGER